MSEFIAQVRAELDPASLSAIQEQLDSIGKKGNLKLRVDSGNTTGSINKVSSSITTAKKNAQSFGDTLKQALGIGSAVAVTLTAFREIEKAAGKAVDAVKDFDTAIASVRTVTGASYDSAAQMVKGYNDFGKALGATTNEVSQSAVTWLRQGKTAQEANTLIRDSMMLSKIGMLDSEQAATYLTSAMNGYKISVSDAVTVVDKLGKLDSSAAVTAGGLAEAMSRTANIANDAGISIDRLLGYLATMGEVTQLDMGSIGNSMKTILSRMSAIKAGKLSLVDEDGTVESLSDVETTLNGVGIKLRDSDNEFRNFGDVLDETAAKWNDLSTTQQAAIAQSFAGTRMQNNFRVLMNNYDKAMQYMNTASNSAGTAEQKFGAYLDSLEAKSKTLQATFEGLAVNTLDTGFAAGLIDASTAIIKLVDDTNLLKGAIAGLGTAGAIAGFTAFTNGIRTAVQHLSSFDAALKMLKAGNIGTAEIETLAQVTAGLSTSQLKAVLSSEALTTAQRLQILQMQGLTEAEAVAQLETMGLATAQGTATAATTTLGGAIKGLWATLKANPLILVITAITAVVSAYSTYKQKQEEARQAALDAGSAARDEAENIKTLYAAYEKAKTAYDNNTGSKEDLEGATSALIEGLGLEATEVEKLTGAYGDLSAAIQQATIDSLKKQLLDLTSGYSAAMDEVVAAADEVDGWANNREVKLKTGGNDAKFVQRLIDAGYAYNDLGPFGTTTGFIGIDHTNGYDAIINDYQRLLSMQAELEAGVDEGLYTRTELAGSDAYNKVTAQINGIKSAYDEVFQYIDDINETAAQIQLMEWQKTNEIPETAADFALFKQEMMDTAVASGQFVGSQQDIENAINNTISSMSGFSEVATEYETAVSTIDDIQSAAMEANSKTTELANGIGKVQDILGEQATGKNLSLADYNSDELKEYTSALEYHNGVLQLNADKVNEIIEAKVEEQKAINESNKALAQSKYLENAKAIEQLRDRLRTNNLLEGETEQSIRDNIAALLAENSTLYDTCQRYDLMTSTLEQATSAYQNWINAQSASQAGDMFDSAIGAFKKIDDTLNNATSDSYGRIGNADYEAAIEFVIPDSVDSTDEAAINSYLDSIDKYFTWEDGTRTGLDIAQFCQDAVDAGLMTLDENGENYTIAGQTTMEDFAEGLGLSLPLVQAMFGEMEEFGAHWDWSDEAIKSMQDLGVAAYESAESLRGIEGNSNLKIVMDVSDFEDKELAIQTLDETIQEMNGVKAKPGVDASEIEYANTVIQYCVAQKQMLNAPAVMSVDTSQVTGEIGTALELLQQFQTAKNSIEMQAAVGADTSEAEAQVNSLVTEIQALSPDIKATLGIDSTSAETITTSLQALTPEMLVKAGVDSSLVDAYQEAEHNSTGTVTWDNNTSTVDSYAGAQKYAFGTVKWGNDTSLVRTSFTAVGRVNWINANPSFGGPNSVTGSAMAGGNWGTKRGGKTLVGELGREIVVSPKSGKWYTVGDRGAEFVDLPKGSIVFNHLQTEDLLRDGNTLGRALSLAKGTALAMGNAMVTGGISVGQANKSTNTGSGSSSGGSTASATTSSKKSGGSSNSAKETAKDTVEAVDWIAVAIDRLERAIKRLGVTASSTYKDLKTRLDATYDQMLGVADEIALQEKAAKRYMEQAESVGLSDELAQKVRDGTIDIEDYDEDTRKLIEDYRKWYEASIECSDAVADLHEKLADLYSDNFSNIANDYSNQLSLLEHLTTTYKTGLDQLNAKGYLETKVYYAALKDVEKQNISILQDELSALTKSLSEAMNSGEIEQFSDEWYSMQAEINRVKEAIQEAEVAVLEYDKAMRELDWSYFDYAQDRISQLTQEADFLSDLISNDDLYDERGQINASGMSVMGLHGMKYNVYMNQADQYAMEAQKIARELANDPYNDDLIQRREELLKLQQESILAAEDEKQAIIDMVEDGINLELDALKELITKYTDAISEAKSLYDYQHKLSDQTSEIASLQKQLSAYTTGNDTSEETRATVQKLQANLAKAEGDLEQTEFDKYISDQKALVSTLYDQYSQLLNQRLDDIDLLFQQMISSVNLNSQAINDTLWSAATEVGYTLSSGMATTWGAATTAIADALAEGGGINGLISSGNILLQETIDAINNKHYLTQEEAKKAAEEGNVALQGTISTYTPGGEGGSWEDYKSRPFTQEWNSVTAALGTNGELNKSLGNILMYVNGSGETTTLKQAVEAGNSPLATAYEAEFGSLEAAVRALKNGDATPTGYVDNAKKNSDTEAKEVVKSPTTKPTTTPTKTTPTTKPSTKPTTKPSATTPTKPKAPELKKGAVVELKPGTKWYYSSDGVSPIGDANSWLKGHKAVITQINNASWATHPYSITVDGDGVTGGWVRKQDIVGYSTGGLVNKTGPAWLDGTPQKPEIVLSQSDSKNFLALRDVLASVADNGINITPQVHDISALAGRSVGLAGVNTTSSVGDVHNEITIEIDHVEDYNDFVNKLRSDPKFEKMVQSMTVDRLSGGSSLAKNRYKW